ncbi:MAG: PQQ-dependent sugar dehydrogenase, partial [Planctomycetota bacterium]
MRRLVPAVALLLLGLAPACGGGGGAPPPGPGGGTAPANLSYSESPAWYRAGTAIPTNAASWTGGAPTLFEVAPPLPAGLLLDAVSGDVTGTPVAPAAPALFTFTASNAAGSDSVDVQIAVGDPLPAAFASLAPGFNAEVVMEGLMVPVKIAMAGDGRIFFNELMTGDTRIILADGTLQAQVFAHADLVLGPHQGLLGLVLHPAFDTDPTKRWVYTMTCTPGTGPLVDRIQVKRYLEVGGVGTGETIVVDDLPMGAINNGGDLLFGPDQVVPGDGGLFVSLGDTDDPNLAQTDGSLAGRILRYTEDGAPHPDNPKPITDPFEWDRGLRNTFCLAVHPVTGDLYGADNGPAANDW